MGHTLPKSYALLKVQNSLCKIPVLNIVLSNCHVTLYISLCKTDMPAQTATGTVAIQVEDFNDHCPTLATEFETMCTPLDSVIVAAIDEDSFPNGPPFDFSVVTEGTKGKWKVEHLNGKIVLCIVSDINFRTGISGGRNLRQKSLHKSFCGVLQTTQLNDRSKNKTVQETTLRTQQIVFSTV